MICSVKRFSEMYETVYRDLYHYALCLMKNPQEAEDAVSEAVVAAYENIHKLKKEEACDDLHGMYTEDVERASAHRLQKAHDKAVEMVEPHEQPDE